MRPYSNCRLFCPQPANVAEARDWINAWKSKTEARQNRPSWFPGSKLPDHLDGSLPADFGFDPLSLGVDAGKLKWCVFAPSAARCPVCGAIGCACDLAS